MYKYIAIIDDIIFYITVIQINPKNMLKIPPQTSIDFQPSLIAKNKDGKTILMIDVRFSSLYASADIEILNMEEYQHIPFLMFVNSNVMRIFKSPNFQEIAKFDIKKILAFYDPKSIKGIIPEFTLIIFIHLWLNNLDCEWKREKVPYFEEMNNLGLLKLLDGVTTEDFD